MGGDIFQGHSDAAQSLTFGPLPKFAFFAPVDLRLPRMTGRIKQTNERIAAARDFLLQSFKTACLAHRLSETEAATVLARLVLEVGDNPAAAAALPAEAPERWSERAGRKENLVAFIRSVYAPWLEHGLRRSHPQSLDRPLYRALAVWLHRHPDAGMPTTNRVRDRVAEALADHCKTGALRALPRGLRIRVRTPRRAPGQRPQPWGLRCRQSAFPLPSG